MKISKKIITYVSSELPSLIAKRTKISDIFWTPPALQYRFHPCRRIFKGQSFRKLRWKDIVLLSLPPPPPPNKSFQDFAAPLNFRNLARISMKPRLWDLIRSYQNLSNRISS